MKSMQKSLFLSLLLAAVGSCATNSEPSSLTEQVGEQSKVQKDDDSFAKLEQFHFTEAKNLSAIAEIQGMDLSTEQAVLDFKASLKKKGHKKSLHALFLIVDRENQLVFFSHAAKPVSKLSDAEKTHMISEKLASMRNNQESASYGIVLFNDSRS